MERMTMVDKEYTISIASEPANISEVEALIDQIREENNIKDEVFGNLMISMTEAVNNAITHGNLEDAAKQVIVSAELTSDTIKLKVQDQGAGFDFNNLPDPTDPENLEKVTGRGVFLMRQLSDELEYSNGGNTVEMSFKLA